MAIRKPVAPAAKSAVFGEFLAGQAAVQGFKSGSIIEGTVSAVKGSDVFVDIGYKSEGMVDRAEFGDVEVTPGLKFQVKLIDLEDDKTGMVRLSKKAADDQIRWQKILERYTEGCVVTGTIRSKVNGGLIVDIDGVEAFLPGSQVDVSVGRDRDRDLTPYIGQTYDFKVIKISNERKNIIVSRRELIQAANDEKKEALLASLQKDEIRAGTVKNITDFGAFIDLDGIDGLLHITDMSWGRVKHPSELLKVGDKINVKVLDVDREKERISLGLKQTTPNPWDTIAEQFPVGARVAGKVVNLAPYGAFVEIAPGIEGLVHISEFSWTKRVNKPEEMLSQGDEVQVQVLAISIEEQKISLGIKQTTENPWDTAQDRYPVGSRQTGTVRNFTAYGAFVQLEDSIDGMIHISDMSWTRKITRPEECLKKGQQVETIVLDVDTKNHRISLGLKQAQTDPWTEIASKYQVGTLVKGKVSKLASFGAFVELEDGVDGLVHISQISDQRIEKVRDALKEGDEVEARVVKVDRNDRRIGLSIRAVSMTEEEVKALEAEAYDSDVAQAGSSSTQGSEQLGSLGAAFDALGSVEWQPGEDK